MPRKRKQESQGIELELTESEFIIANRDWVWDPGREGVEYVFGRTQRAAGLLPCIPGS